MRNWLAVLTGKFVMRLLRLIGRGGTTLPGRIALAVAPGVPEHLTSRLRRGTVVITGTNGKTTTTMLLALALKRNGDRVVFNRTGANMLPGITSALIEAAGLNGRVDADWFLCETDEGAAATVVSMLSPRLLVVTNCFRDQLDRYGEVEHTAGLLARAVAAMPPGSMCLLNADDPLVGGTADGARGEVRFFGLRSDIAIHDLGLATDIRHCLRCQKPLSYRAVYYAHLGWYQCRHCGQARPRADFLAAGVTSAGLRGSAFVLQSEGQRFTVALGIPGLVNVYNALAASAAAVLLGVGSEPIRDALASAPAAFGRMERLSVNGRELFMTLVKNPTGFNEVLAMLLEDPGPKPIMIAINDQLADGTDVSWLWDVAFEILTEGDHVPWLVVSGQRAADMAVRLKYAGQDMDQVIVEPDLSVALELALERTAEGDTLYILPTYTAMLGIRAGLHRRGSTTPYWEGQ